MQRVKHKLKFGWKRSKEQKWIKNETGKMNQERRTINKVKQEMKEKGRKMEIYEERMREASKGMRNTIW